MEQLVYITDGFWREIGDQRVHSNYPLMSGGPLPIIMIVSSYVYFVRVLGPKWMKRRDAMDLKWTIRIYNILMSLVNFYAFCRVSLLTNFGLSYFGCKQVGQTQVDNELVNIAFLYFATKIVELLDTIFFILRKKYNQASNLHVFHHGFIAVCVWIYFKIAPGGSSVLFPYLNLGVHSIMYGYYFLATFKSLQSSLWWKRHLTEAQIVQFVLSMVHFSFQGLSSCQYPPVLAIIGFTFNLVFFVLFCDFYYHAYLKKRQQQQPVSSSTRPISNESHLQRQPLLTKSSTTSKTTQELKDELNRSVQQQRGYKDENNNLDLDGPEQQVYNRSAHLRKLNDGQHHLTSALRSQSIASY